jgi:hypothetical protein
MDLSARYSIFSDGVCSNGEYYEDVQNKLLDKIC